MNICSYQIDNGSCYGCSEEYCDLVGQDHRHPDEIEKERISNKEKENKYLYNEPYKEYKQSKTCSICGIKNLHWEKLNDKWRLFDENNQLHICSHTYEEKENIVQKNEDKIKERLLQEEKVRIIIKQKDIGETILEKIINTKDLYSILFKDYDWQIK